MQKIEFSAGDVLFNEGDPSDGSYKIVSGKVEIRIGVKGVLNRDQVTVLATAGAGEIIGEMGAIDGAPRSATAVAAEPTSCEHYTSEEIVQLLENDPQEAMAYVRTLIRRLRNSNRSASFNARLGG